ncbi:hypothetical protein DERP_000786 [Dermatophagoides pteronyssinus]|uniref:Uncharacterized protein n=1 Tax=Dermatophagoides pteronyssinus TaxID=6956 RepID=A0ABQ8J148_DERPT|nr:hypothetical protein DERP_000786 [Dermatophagoides pteronyssinus]
MMMMVIKYGVRGDDNVVADDVDVDGDAGDERSSTSFIIIIGQEFSLIENNLVPISTDLIAIVINAIYEYGDNNNSNDNGDKLLAIRLAAYNDVFVESCCCNDDDDEDR